MKVVKIKSDGKIVYRSNPEFEEGFGIKSAIVLHGGLSEDYEEIEILEKEWDEKVIIPLQTEVKIREEERRLLREQAMANLENPNI